MRTHESVQCNDTGLYIYIALTANRDDRVVNIIEELRRQTFFRKRETAN